MALAKQILLAWASRGFRDQRGNILHSAEQFCDGQGHSIGLLRTELDCRLPEVLSIPFMSRTCCSRLVRSIVHGRTSSMYFMRHVYFDPRGFKLPRRAAGDERSRVGLRAL